MSDWRLTQALTALHAARRTILEADPDLVLDEIEISTALVSEQETVEDAIRRTIAAAVTAEDMADQAAERVRRLTERRDRYKRRGESLRAAVFAAMDAIGAARMEWPEATISIVAPRATAVVTDADALPDEYVQIERKPKKAMILDALKAGTSVSGAELRNGMPSLQVRTR